jgi:hypothetical protein
MKPSLQLLDHLPHDPISSLYALVDFIDAHTLCSTLQHWVLLAMSNSRDSRYDDTEQRAALPAFSRDMSHVIQALYSLRKNKQKHTAAWSDWLVISKFSERYSYEHCRAHLFQLADAVISYEGELPVDRVDFMCYLEAFLTIAALVHIPETWLGTWMERNEPKQMAM